MRKLSLNKIYPFILGVLILTPLGVQAEKSPLDIIPSWHWTYVKMAAWAERGLLDGKDALVFEDQKPLTRYQMAFYIEKVKPRILAPSNHPGIKTPFVKFDERDEEELSRLISEYRVELELLESRYSRLRERRQDLRKRIAELEKVMSRAEENVMKASLKDKKVRAFGVINMQFTMEREVDRAFRKLAGGETVLSTENISNASYSFFRSFLVNIRNEQAGQVDWNVSGALGLFPDSKGVLRDRQSSTGVFWLFVPTGTTFRADFDTEGYDVRVDVGKVLFTRGSMFTYQGTRPVTYDWTLGRNDRTGEWADRQIHGAVFDFRRLPWELRAKVGIGLIQRGGGISIGAGIGSEREFFTSGGHIEKSVKKHLLRVSYGWMGEPDANPSGIQIQNLAVAFQDIARVDDSFKLTAEIGVGIMNTGYFFDWDRWHDEAISGKWLAGYDFPAARLNTKRVGHALRIQGERRVDIFDYSIPLVVEYTEISPSFPGMDGLGLVRETMTTFDEYFNPKDLVTFRRPVRWELYTQARGVDGLINNRRALKASAKFKRVFQGVFDITYKVEKEIEKDGAFYFPGQTFYPSLGLDGDQLTLWDPTEAPRFFRPGIQLPTETLPSSPTVGGDLAYNSVGDSTRFLLYDPETGTGPAGRYYFSQIRLEFATALYKLPILRDLIRTNRSFIGIAYSNISANTSPAIKFDDTAIARRSFVRVSAFASLTDRLTLGLGWGKGKAESRFASEMEGSGVRVPGPANPAPGGNVVCTGSQDGFTPDPSGGCFATYFNIPMSIVNQQVSANVEWYAPGGIRARAGASYDWARGESPNKIITSRALGASMGASIGF